MRSRVQVIVPNISRKVLFKANFFFFHLLDNFLKSEFSLRSSLLLFFVFLNAAVYNVHKRMFYSHTEKKKDKRTQREV